MLQRKRVIVFLCLISLLLLAAFAAGGFASSALAQSKDTATPPSTPQWMIDAGGKAQFDVVSIKRDVAEPSPTTTHTNVTMLKLDPQTGAVNVFLVDHIEQPSEN